MPLSDNDFHTPVHHRIFRYLVDNYPQFHFFYVAPEFSPKGFMKIRTVGKYGEKIATVILNLDDSVSIHFTSIMVSKKNRTLLTQALQEAEIAAKKESPMINPQTVFASSRDKIMFDHIKASLDPASFSVYYSIDNSIGQIIVSKDKVYIYSVVLEPQGKTTIKYFSDVSEKFKESVDDLIDRCPSVSPEDDHFYEEIITSP